MISKYEDAKSLDSQVFESFSKMKFLDIFKELAYTDLSE